MGNHIEINGKRYDAQTGKLLASSSAHQPAKPAPAARRSQHPQTVSRNIHTSTQRSQALMRKAVSKPSASPTVRPVRPVMLSDIARASSVAHKSPKPERIDPERAKRAAQMQRSQLVSKFHHGAPTAVRSRVEPLKVKTAPAATPAPAPAPQSKTHHIIEQGLRNAQSHAQPARRTPAKRSRLVSLVASGMAILLLGAFVTYQNIPNISMRYAAQRAGVAAAMPGYQPAGFHLNNRIQYTPGQITLSFQSNSDERQFTITQRESTWNSDTLRTNYVATSGAPVQTFEDKGRTIYLYGDSNATWVNGGVWYDIKGNSQLNSDQLIRIATSM